MKLPLTKSPFVLKFEYGASGDGYWVYEHMVLQLEDCVNCCTVFYPEHNVLFMLDHSCGQRRGGLNAKNMNKSFGSNQPKMHDTMIHQEQGFWGPYLRQLQSRDVQKISFESTGTGPFWMSHDEWEKLRHDIIIEGQL